MFTIRVEEICKYNFIWLYCHFVLNFQYLIHKFKLHKCFIFSEKWLQCHFWNSPFRFRSYTVFQPDELVSVVSFVQSVEWSSSHIHVVHLLRSMHWGCQQKRYSNTPLEGAIYLPFIQTVSHCIPVILVQCDAFISFITGLC